MKQDGFRWKFFRSGGVDQVVFRAGADIAHLEELDQKLWVALACPTKGLELDSRTLQLIDTDRDGRVRASEVLSAVKWIKEAFKDPDGLLKGGDSVLLAAINDSTETGKMLLAGAKRLLHNLGKEDAEAIALADVLDIEKIFAETKFNGDGVILPASADDAPTRKVIEEVMATVGTVPDRSKKAGIDASLAEKFFADARALSDWHDKAESDRSILLAGEATAPVAAAVSAVRAKVDDYFARCRLAAFDVRAAAHMNGDEATFTALARKCLTEDFDEIAALPLARVEPGRPLSLAEGLNPAWVGPMAALKDAAGSLVAFKDGKLQEAEWKDLKAKVAAYEAWMAGKPSTPVEKLGLPRLRAILAGKFKDAIAALIEKDKALDRENAQIESLEKLVRYQRDFHQLLRNFINFADFYSGKGATFQAGTLFLDGRSCDLCIRVEDAAKHASMAALAKTYLAYCDCVRPATGGKMTIAAAFTNGDSDNLMVGRNGLFYDRKGDDWDATITRIVDNPISIRESFWKPYKTFLRMIEEQVAKRAAVAEAESSKKLEAGATAVVVADKTPAAAKPEAKKIDVGTVAALGVAIGGLGAFLSGILGMFFNLGLWIPVGIIGVILAISGPSMLIAWLKLRQRNLGPILDANGWAVNGRVKVNVPFGGALTSIARLPSGAERSLKDPYAEKKPIWPYVAAVLAVVLGLAGAWWFEKLDPYLPEQVQKAKVFAKPAAAPGAEAPASAKK